MAGVGLKILIVEDDASIRETLADLLESEGYAVSTADSAEAGLKVLNGLKVDLLLTDYALPGNTGTWMVENARKQGLLRDVPAVVISAHPRLDNPERLEVMKKPLDVDQFLERVAALLEPARRRLAEATVDQLVPFSAERKAAMPDRVQPPTSVELVLYISTYSPSSLKALRNVQRVLSRYEPSLVTLRVCDLSKEPPGAADEDRIAFTPTLVKRKPGPRTWILGDLENTKVLEDLLAVSGMESKG